MVATVGGLEANLNYGGPLWLVRECECCVHARAVLTWRDHEREWSPGRRVHDRWAVPWADGFTGQMGWHAVVVRGSDRLQPLRLPSSSWPHFKYVQPALRLPSVLAARHIRLHELNMSAKFARSLGSISSGGRPPRTPRVVMMAQLCGGLRAKNENVASDNSP